MEREAFSCSAGQFLNQICQHHSEYNYAFDLAIAHPVHAKQYRGYKKQLISCNPRLHANIHVMRPQVIVCIGNMAKVALGMGSAENLDGANGDIRRYRYADGTHCWLVPCIPLLSDGNGKKEKEGALNNPGKMWRIQLVMDKALSLVDAEARWTLSPDRDEGFPPLELIRKGAWVEALLDCADKLTTIDIETTGFDPKTNRLLCASITYRNEDGDLVTYWSADATLKQLAEWFPKGPRIMHNAKFELKWIKPQGDVVFHDTFLRAGFVDENESHTLDDLSVRYAGAWPYWADLTPYDDWEAILQHGQPDKLGAVKLGGKTMLAAELMNEIGTYCGWDTLFTHRLYEDQETKLSEANIKFLNMVANPLTYVLVKMEEAGQQVDVEKLAELRSKTEARLKVLTKELYDAYGDIEWDSPQKVGELIYGKLGISVTRKTAGGKPSTSKEALDEIIENEPKLAPLKEYRYLMNKKSCILDAWENLIDGVGRLHGVLNHGFAVTGRLTCSNPNMQNISREGEEKLCLISRFKGGKLIKADYGQFELRICAAHARDRAIKRAIAQGYDLHTLTAELLEIDRQVAKAVNLSLAGGAGAGSLHYSDGIPKADAKIFTEKWLRKYPEIAKLHKKVEVAVKTRKQVKNLFGRVRHLPMAASPHQKEQRRALNQGRSMVLQGGGADIIQAAMVKYDAQAKLSRDILRAILVMQIHDEIIVDSPPEEVKAVADLLEACMLDPWDEPLYIPMAVDMEIGPTMAK